LFEYPLNIAARNCNVSRKRECKWPIVTLAYGARLPRSRRESDDYLALRHLSLADWR